MLITKATGVLWSVLLRNPIGVPSIRDGYTYLGRKSSLSGQHEFPIDPNSMSSWSQRVGKEGMKKLFKELL